MKSPLPSKRQKDFAKFYVENIGELGSVKAQVEAYKQNYHPPEGLTDEQIRARAKNITRTPRIRGLIEELQQGMRYQFIMLAPRAMERLEQLAESAESEKVKLQANIEILDRGGLKPPERVELATVGVFGSASLDEVRDILKRNLETVESELQEVN